MKALLLLLMPFMALSQTTRLDYFRTSSSDNQVLLQWTTFAEDGTDLFTVHASQDAKAWEKIGEVKSCEVKTGCTYVFCAGDRVGVWYYRLKWTDGIYYTTSTTKQRKKIDPLSGYNILGQKMY